MANEIGSLEVGKRADIVIHSLDRPEAHPRFQDPVDSLVFYRQSRTVDTVIIDGEAVYDGGRFTRFDAAEAYRQIDAAASRFEKRSGSGELHHLADRGLTPVRGSTRTDTDVVIVGAGHNGLVAAFYLARAGLRVQVLEARSLVGGALATEELIDGFRFSTCAFRLWGLQRPVIQDMGLAGRVTVRKPEPTVLRLYPDGRALKQWSDLRRTAAELESFSPGRRLV